ncbi:unnamed protein product [Pleuronectes platessa]|uniref:EGF-like domain-containing protein n=1 Tax=Pleuronectes platessa TaxID=8262 RepID=A0A9N7V2V7_PLEPL|nr:unnamed protein product [Pleuronectes platessa]
MQGCQSIKHESQITLKQRIGRPDCILCSFSLPPAMATLASLLLAPRGIDLSLPTCGETQCNSHGACVSPPGGGVNLLCDCDLGYQGESCEDTVNGSLSVPLTLSVLGAIIGVVILAFIIAKVRQHQKKNRRKNAAKKLGHDVVV